MSVPPELEVQNVFSPEEKMGITSGNESHGRHMVELLSHLMVNWRVRYKSMNIDTFSAQYYEIGR